MSETTKTKISKKAKTNCQSAKTSFDSLESLKLTKNIYESLSFYVLIANLDQL